MKVQSASTTPKRVETPAKEQAATVQAAKTPAKEAPKAAPKGPSHLGKSVDTTA